MSESVGFVLIVFMFGLAGVLINNLLRLRNNLLFRVPQSMYYCPVPIFYVQGVPENVPSLKQGDFFEDTLYKFHKASCGPVVGSHTTIL